MCLIFELEEAIAYQSHTNDGKSHNLVTLYVKFFNYQDLKYTISKNVAFLFAAAPTTI